MKTQNMIIPADILPLPNLEKATNSNELYDLVQIVTDKIECCNGLTWAEMADEILYFDGEEVLADFFYDAEAKWFELDENC